MKPKHSAYAVVAISLALFGCVEKASDKISSGAAGSKEIKVTIVGGKIAVDPDPLHVTADIGTITWNLPEKSKYIFNVNDGTTPLEPLPLPPLDPWLFNDPPGG